MANRLFYWLTTLVIVFLFIELVQYSGGFSTDVSESCIWLTPFIKKPGDMVDLWYCYFVFKKQVETRCRIRVLMRSAFPVKIKMSKLLVSQFKRFSM